VTIGGLAGMLVALAFVLALLGITLHFLRRLTGQVGGGNGHLPLAVLQRVAITPRQALALVRVRERVIVVSSGEGGVRLLLELEGDDARSLLASTTEGVAPSRVAREAVGAVTGRGKVFLDHLQDAIRRRTAIPALLLACSLAAVRVAAAQDTTTAPPVAEPRIAQPQFAPVLPPTTPLYQAPPPAPVVAPLPPLPRAPQVPQTAPGSPVARGAAAAQRAAAPQLDLRLGDTRDGALHLSGSVGTVLALGLLTMLPTLVLLMTSFTRIIIVLHLLRQALGTQSAPPAHLMGALALLLTGFVMSPTLSEVNRTALEPWMQGRMEQAEMLTTAQGPFREFMLRQTRDQDLSVFVDMSGTKAAKVEEVPLTVLASAFITSELRTAFQIGFVLFLPFIIIDIVVAAVLMSMGMFMLPPAMISLPFKLLLFVLVDGWTLVVQSLVASFR
jgi:flagellar biosynthetic protein FliP